MKSVVNDLRMGQCRVHDRLCYISIIIELELLTKID